MTPSDPSGPVAIAAGRKNPAESRGLAIVALARKLKEGDVQARCEAAHDLALLADPRVYPLLFQALDDKDPRVRLQAVRGLGHLTALSSEARRALRAVSDDPDASVRIHVAKVMRRRGKS